MVTNLLTSETFTADKLFSGTFPKVSRSITLLSGESRTRGAVLGRISKAAGTPTKVGTGNGTITGFTLGAKAIIGNYKAICTALSPGKSAGAAEAGANTGNGTVGTVTLGSAAKLGTYVLRCTAISPGKSGASAKISGTGDGAVGAATLGAAAQLGTYVLICIAESANAGTFKVIAPNGERLDDLTVAVAYTGAHINLTIEDGATDWGTGAIVHVVVTATAGNTGTFSVHDPEEVRLADATVAVGYVSDHINFTIADGSTDFAVGDSFTILVSATAGNTGIFEVRTPDGERLADATVAVAYTGNHINFTITDGSTDYAVGDVWTIPVAAGSGKYKLSLAAAVDGSQTPEAILADTTDASAGDMVTNAYVSGQFNTNALTLGASHTVASIKEDLAARGIYLETGIAA